MKNRRDLFTAINLREVADQFRPVYERWLDSTRTINVMMLDAWEGGYLPELWEVLHAEYPQLYLHYFIRARGLGDIKIGKTNHIAERLKPFRTHTSRGVDLVACYPAAIGHERELHDDFSRHRLSGEWFIGHSEILSYLRLIGSNPEKFTNETAGRA